MTLGEAHRDSNGDAASASSPSRRLPGSVVPLDAALGPAGSPRRPQEAVLNFSNLYWGDEKSSQVVEAARNAAPGPIHLDLRGNRFGPAGAKALADFLARGPHSVASICLEWNNVGQLDEGVDAIARALEVDATLVSLDLRNNNVGPEGAKALARALRRNRTLRRLDLRWNEIGGAGVLAFREALQGNHTLLTLELMGNNCSLKQVEEIEKLLVRNQTLQEERRIPDLATDPGSRDNNPCSSPAASPQKPAVVEQPDHHSDKLLLHLMAEKDELEAAVATSTKDKRKLGERIDELEAQVLMLQKEATVAKEDRDRYQTREADAKREIHELKMKLDELENKRALEFEEYRTARLAVEKENVLARERLLHIESLAAKNSEQKAKQIAQLEEETYKLQGELHRKSLALCSEEAEVAKLTTQLAEAHREHERREAGLVASHESKLEAATREHELAMNSLRAQLELATSNGEAAQQSSRELKEKAETLQAKLLQAEIEHERARAELKKQWELDVQDRVQRTVTAVQTQLEEVKGGRQHLEKEVAKLQLEIARLGEERVELQQAHAQQLRVTKEELLEREQELHTAADRVRALQMEQQQVEELRQQQERRLQEQSRRMETTQAALEERIQRMTSAEQARAREFAAAMADKSTQLAALETKAAALERERAAQRHEHERRVDELGDAIAGFVQQQMASERARRAAAAGADA